MSTHAIPIFDTAQLHRHTGGNPSHQVEVLSLFISEVERLMRQVEIAPDAQVRGDRLRAIAGVARNIGAARIAQEARAVQKEISGDGVDLEPLRAAVSDTFAFIRRSRG